jgi:hypothetical protein
MTTMPAHPAPRRASVSQWRLWFGLFGGPAAWSVQMIANYALDAHSCFPRETPLTSPIFDPVRIVTAAVAAAMLVISLASLWVAYDAWQRTRDGGHREHRELLEVGEGRARFMAFAGVLLSSIFAFGVLMNAIPIVALPACAG